MKYRSVTMAAALVLAGGLTLAGCQSDKSGGSASGAGATTQQGGAPSTGTNTSTTAAAATSASARTTGQSSTGGGGGGNSGSSICQAGDLNVSLASQNEVSGQIIQWVQLENKTAKACTMDGFAGVDLVGSANGKSDYDWPLGRDSEHYSKFTLKAGESAYFGIKYLPWASGDGTKIDVAKIKLTPPNTTTTVTLSFSAAILLQDAATHPGTYLTPIALGRLN